MKTKYGELGDDFRLFSGRANPELAEEVAEELGVKLGKIRIRTFPDTEVHAQVEESVRGTDVYIIQPTCPPVNDNLMELLIMIDAFRRASVRQITAVIPYYGYSRQDRKATGREPISARLVADLLVTAGVDRVVSVDLHTPQIQGFFKIPMDHLTALYTFVEYFKKKDLTNAVIVSPDVGRAKLAEKYASLLELPLVLMHKRRAGICGDTVEVVEIVGDVKGKVPIVIDDIIASGSIINQVRRLREAGAEPAYLAITHPVLVGKSLEHLRSDDVREVVVTNTIPIPDWKREKLGPKLKVLSIAPLLAKVIAKIHRHESVSEVFYRA
ncbi:phosphoribosylpyrophosphate synthetase [Candidatus Poribacteria bacterium]|nr:MAG: phosphoribosylpyrophosphate synthetase [Candidatus Poribacteria bacterium]